MDDKVRRAEELLEQRKRDRGGNGHTNVADEQEMNAAHAARQTEPSSSDQKAEELTNDLKRMAAISRTIASAMRRSGPSSPSSRRPISSRRFSTCWTDSIAHS